MDDQKIAIAYLGKAERAKAKGHEFKLTFNQFKKLKQKKTCTYTGLPLTATNLTLERIDNQEGYTKDNTIAVCQSANGLKAFIENPTNLLTEKLVERMMSKIRQLRGE